MGIFASASYTCHKIDHSIEGDGLKFDDVFWAAVSQASLDMAKDSSKLRNQLGKSRDGSWQLSNLMTFDGKLDSRDNAVAVAVDKVFFWQPGHAVGEPLDFNIVSTKGGDLAICTRWQLGAIGLEGKKDSSIESVERDFMRNVLRDMERYLLVMG